MKKLTILLFSILISFSSYGEWTKVTSSTVNKGTDIYIDLDTIKEHNDYVYYWSLSDVVTPVTAPVVGDTKSIKVYKQGDCKVMRYKVLSIQVYKQSMGNGNYEDIGGLDEWQYPEPNNTARFLLNYACNYVK